MSEDEADSAEVVSKLNLRKKKTIAKKTGAKGKEKVEDDDEFMDVEEEMEDEWGEKEFVSDLSGDDGLSDLEDAVVRAIFVCALDLLLTKHLGFWRRSGR